MVDLQLSSSCLVLSCLFFSSLSCFCKSRTCRSSSSTCCASVFSAVFEKNVVRGTMSRFKRSDRWRLTFLVLLFYLSLLRMDRAFVPDCFRALSRRFDLTAEPGDFLILRVHYLRDIAVQALESIN
ncbi:hypothetical protein JOL62DRAFT_581865 [Phyllosticta paracitricarpa]|uniref:Secreted protein n=1 Tax=Phyllosticta paracitricarpa TaxID=2016321 RepID=A0ABR1MZ37_9PEZI